MGSSARVLDPLVWARFNAPSWEEFDEAIVGIADGKVLNAGESVGKRTV